MAAKAHWLDVANELDLVTRTSTVGKKMFSFAHELVVAERVSVVMSQCSEDLAKCENLTEPTMRETTNKAMDQLKLIGGIDDMAKKRKVTIVYRGVQVEMIVFSLAEELSLRGSAVLKARAVEAKKLDPLHCENELVDASLKQDHQAFEEKLITAANIARRSANAMVTAEGDPSGVVMRDILFAKQGVLIQMDKSFKLEINFVASFTGAGGEERLISKIKECLPSGDIEMQPKDSVGKLCALMNTQLFRFCSAGGQGKVSTVRQFVTSLSMGQRPNLQQLDNSDFMKSIGIRLANFARVVQSGGSEAAPQVLLGKAAVDHIFLAAKRKIEANTPYDLELLSTFAKFHWLLDAEQREQAAQWTKNLLVGFNHGGGGEKEQPSKKDKKKEDTAKKSKDDTSKHVQSLFD